MKAHSTPWVLALSPRHPFSQRRESLGAHSVARAWHALHLKGELSFGVRVLAGHHPLSPLPPGAKAENDRLLSTATGLDCRRARVLGMPLHLVHAPQASDETLSTYRTETTHALGMPGDSALQSREHGLDAHALYESARALTEHGACVGTYADDPATFEVGARIRQETGLPFFAHLPSLTARDFQSASAGWRNRIHAGIAHSTAVVFDDEATLSSLLPTLLPSIDLPEKKESLALLSSGLMLASDHAQAVATARFGELSIEERRKVVGLAKSLEGALGASQLSFAHPYSIHSPKACLCPPALSFHARADEARASWNPGLRKQVRNSLQSLPTLSGRALGKRATLMFAKTGDEGGAQRFLTAASTLPPTAGILLPSLSSHQASHARKLGIADRIAVLPAFSPSEALRTLASCDVLLAAHDSPQPLSSLDSLLASSALGVCSDDANAKPLLAILGPAPFGLSSLKLTLAGIESDERAALQETLGTTRTTARLRAGLDEILSQHWEETQVASTLTSFFEHALAVPVSRAD